MSVDYASFLETKRRVAQPQGVDVPRDTVKADLFDFQADLTWWAVRKGRAALFTATGTGKTRMELRWGETVANRTLLLAPLGVARQTVAEAEKIGVAAAYCRQQSDAPREGITVTNYEMVEHFDPDAFEAVVADESSILKSFEGKTRNRLIAMFQETPYRLCGTATPAPNDITEIANHAEFLGIMKRTDMLATFFVHDDAGWRLKKPAREAFYRWLASWAMSLGQPADLGYPNDGYDLPALRIHEVIVPTDYVPGGTLFPMGLKGITERSAVRKETAAARVAAAVELIDRSQKWVVWCGLNDEQDSIAKALGSDCVSVYGALDADEKIRREALWREGDVPVLATKASVFGWGMNWQHCHSMLFLGLSDSYEQYFQAIRRCWRFGQSQPVDVHIVLSEPERPIYDNVLRKEREADVMTKELIRHVAEFEKSEIASIDPHADYVPTQIMRLPAWLAS